MDHKERIRQLIGRSFTQAQAPGEDPFFKPNTDTEGDHDITEELVELVQNVARECMTLAHDWPAAVDGRVPLEIANAIRARFGLED